MSLSQSFSQKIGNVRPLNPCPSLDIDFVNGGYVNDLGFANQASVGSANFNIGSFNGVDPVFTRASAATFRGSNGLIQYAPENLLLRSEEFDTVWTRNGILAFGSGSIANAVESPFGTVTADKITPDLVTSTFKEIRQDVAVTSGATYTFSIYAKPAGYRYLQLVGTSTQFGTFAVNFDLQTGLETFFDAGTSTVVGRGISAAANGFYRAYVSVTAVATGVGRISPNIVPASNSVRGVSWASDGSSGIYIWGAQLERSSTARPYISTTTTERYGPRFEYDLNGNPLGLLMEEQSANLLQYSEQFDNAYWTKSGATVTPNNAIGPDGLQTADRVVFGAANNEVRRLVSVSGTTTASIYIKGTAGETIAWSNGGVSPAVDVIHTLSGGWDRVVFTTTATNPYVSVNTYSSVTARTIYIWGAQLEAKPFATSYIPTVATVPLTRNADTVNSTIGSWFNQTEGTIVVSGDRSHAPSLNASLYDSFYEFSDNGGGYHSSHFCDGTTEEFYVDNGSATTATANTATIGTLTKIGASYSPSDIYITRDGAAPNSAVGASIGITPLTLNIGYSQALTQAWNGHVKAFRYYPKALPDKLVLLTS